MLDYRILGELEVVRDGERVLLTAPKLRTLLLVLLLRAGEVVSTGRLIDAIWPTSPPASARKLVQVYVSQLRAALGAEAIDTVSTGYRLRVTVTSVDARRFVRLSADGRLALADGNPELALALVRRGLGLWRGPALVDVADEPFATAEAARLDELRLACTEDELDATLALGGHEEALPDLRRLCAEHPLRERTREQLALALYRCSRRAEALELLATGRRLLRDELGLDPGRSHRDLERAILDQDPSLADVRSAGLALIHVPAASSPMVGRSEELEQLGALVTRDDVRVVTISGPGGSGKTRVALELARSAGSAFANGAAFVELASIRDPGLVMGTIAAVLGIPETSQDAAQPALREWLHGRDLLLVLDNFEHLIEAAADVARLVQQAARVTVVVTSRRVLHITGEHVFPLKPLPVDDAVRLFSARVAALDESAPGPGATIEVIRAICHRLDCLPLALELAAARTATLSPRRLLDQLSDVASGLGEGPRDAPARQHTLDETLRWSTDLLDEPARRTLARLSVFAGGSTVEAAEHICESRLESLVSLIDSSLLQRAAAAGEVRLTMLETVRQHAARMLDTADARAATTERHTSYYLALVEAAVLKGPGQADGLRTIDADLDNLRTAIGRAEQDGDDETALRIATALYRYWYLRGLFREGFDRIAGPLERGAGDALLQALALRAIAGLQYLLGDLDQARALATRGVEVASAAGGHEPLLACHTVLSHIARERDQLSAARAHLEQSEAIAQRLGLLEDVMVANTNLGELAMAAGDLDEARLRWERTLAFYGGREQENTTFALLGLGSVASRQGRLDEAFEHFSRARDLAESAGFQHNAMMALVGLAGVAADQGNSVSAALLLGRADGLLKVTGGELTVADDEVYQRARAVALADLGEARSAELVAIGARDPHGR